MGTYYIPRNYRGESRILYIFTVKSLITTAVGAMIGSIFFFIFKSIDMTPIGLGIMAFFGLIGYIIGALKIPTIVAIPITKKIGGEPVGEVILRYMKFRKKENCMYIQKRKRREKQMNSNIISLLQLICGIVFLVMVGLVCVLAYLMKPKSVKEKKDDDDPLVEQSHNEQKKIFKIMVNLQQI